MPHLSPKLSVSQKRILQEFSCNEAAVERGLSHHKAIALKSLETPSENGEQTCGKNFIHQREPRNIIVM